MTLSATPTQDKDSHSPVDSLVDGHDGICEENDSFPESLASNNCTFASPLRVWHFILFQFDRMCYSSFGYGNASNSPTLGALALCYPILPP
jgi:hypothetical protein